MGDYLNNKLNDCFIDYAGFRPCSGVSHDIATISVIVPQQIYKTLNIPTSIKEKGMVNGEDFIKNTKVLNVLNSTPSAEQYEINEIFEHFKNYISVQITYLEDIDSTLLKIKELSV